MGETLASRIMLPTPPVPRIASAVPPSRAWRVLVAAFLVFTMALLPQWTLAAPANPSGLPLPRFASTRSAPVNVRVGPGIRYDIAWIYVKPDIPVEIIQEFDVWRKIRDDSGNEGWVHESLLTGKREALVAPWRENDRSAMRARADEGAAVTAWLPSRFPVSVRSCDGTWCAVTAIDHTDPKRPVTYSGYVAQTDLWGVYQNEKIE